MFYKKLAAICIGLSCHVRIGCMYSDFKDDAVRYEVYTAQGVLRCDGWMSEDICLVDDWKPKHTLTRAAVLALCMYNPQLAEVPGGDFVVTGYDKPNKLVTITIMAEESTDAGSESRSSFSPTDPTESQ